jgi:hypothetical protein
MAQADGTQYFPHLVSPLLLDVFCVHAILTTGFLFSVRASLQHDSVSTFDTALALRPWILQLSMPGKSTDNCPLYRKPKACDRSIR